MKWSQSALRQAPRVSDATRRQLPWRGAAHARTVAFLLLAVRGRAAAVASRVEHIKYKVKRVWARQS